MKAKNASAIIIINTAIRNGAEARSVPLETVDFNTNDTTAMHTLKAILNDIGIAVTLPFKHGHHEKDYIR